MNRKRIIISLLVIAAVVAVIALVSPKKPAKAALVVTNKPSLTVTTERPIVHDWPQKLSATGNVLAWQEAAIGAEVSGLRLSELYANVGDSVKKGQLLARFTEEMVTLDMDQQQAAVDEARARYVQAEAKAESSQKLHDSGMNSKLENIQNQSSAQIARAQLKAAEARYQSQKLRLAYTHVRAPDDGIISARNATVGAVMQTGSELFRYIRRNQLEWKAEVPEGPLQRVRIGQKVVLRSTQGDTVTGKVSRISPVVDVQSRNGSVFVELNASKGLRSGMFAQGEFELGRTSALTVAQSALVVRDGYSYVFKVDADSRAVQLKVNTGRRLDGRIEIVDGLTEGAQVVTAGAGFLTDGDLVQVNNPPADAGQKPDQKPGQKSDQKDKKKANKG